MILHILANWYLAAGSVDSSFPTRDQLTTPHAAATCSARHWAGTPVSRAGAVTVTGDGWSSAISTSIFSFLVDTHGLN